MPSAGSRKCRTLGADQRTEHSRRSRASAETPSRTLPGEFRRHRRPPQIGAGTVNRQGSRHTVGDAIDDGEARKRTSQAPRKLDDGDLNPGSIRQSASRRPLVGSCRPGSRDTARSNSANLARHAEPNRARSRDKRIIGDQARCAGIDSCRDDAEDGAGDIGEIMWRLPSVAVRLHAWRRSNSTMARRPPLHSAARYAAGASRLGRREQTSAVLSRETRTPLRAEPCALQAHQRRTTRMRCASLSVTYERPVLSTKTPCGRESLH